MASRGLEAWLCRAWTRHASRPRSAGVRGVLTYSEGQNSGSQRRTRFSNGSRSKGRNLNVHEIPRPLINPVRAGTVVSGLLKASPAAWSRRPQAGRLTGSGCFAAQTRGPVYASYRW